MGEYLEKGGERAERVQREELQDDSGIIQVKILEAVNKEWGL